MDNTQKKIQDTPDLVKAIETLQKQQALILATVDENGSPHASYAPFAELEGCLYVLLSGLSHHTQHLQRTPKADVMVIEDETTARNIFARARLNYMVDVNVIDKDSTRAAMIIDTMKNKLGKTVDVLVELADFMLFELKPVKARLVIGFGRAYVFKPNDIASAIQLNDENIKSV